MIIVVLVSIVLIVILINSIAEELGEMTSWPAPF